MYDGFVAVFICRQTPNHRGLRYESQKLLHEVDRVGKFESSFGVPAFEITFLISEIQQNRVTGLGNLSPLRRFEVSSALKPGIGSPDNYFRPLVALLAQVPLSCFAQSFRPS